MVGDPREIVTGDLAHWPPVDQAPQHGCPSAGGGHDGWARRLHQTSSWKPSARGGHPSVKRISWSRRVFFVHTRGLGSSSRVWRVASWPLDAAWPRGWSAPPRAGGSSRLRSRPPPTTPRSTCGAVERMSVDSEATGHGHTHASPHRVSAGLSGGRQTAR